MKKEIFTQTCICGECTDGENHTMENNKQEYNDKLVRLDRILKERQWSLYRLSKEADIPYSTLRNLYSRNNEPTISTLEKICQGLNLDINVFFDNKLPISRNLTYTNEEIDLIIDFRSLKNSEKNLLKAYLAGLKHKLPDYDK